MPLPAPRGASQTAPEEARAVSSSASSPDGVTNASTFLSAFIWERAETEGASSSVCTRRNPPERRSARRAAGKYAAERQIQTESGNPFTHGFHGKPALTAFTGKRSPGETDSCGGNARAHQSLRKQERPLPPWGKRGKNRPRQGS